MASLIDLDDPTTVMSYGGPVDASTVEGQVDEESDWRGAVTALLDASTTAPLPRRPHSHPLAAHRRTPSPR